MSSKPYFSVVLPTRNRADLLPSAIRSVLGQSFGDFEIIVSDNNSVDETAQVVQSFDDKRVKYFRSEKPLSIGDSLEFALSHATGEYINFLSDDDAYSKILLERFDQIIKKEKAEIVTCSLAPYYSVDTYNYGKQIEKESLVVFPFNREITVLNRSEAVNTLFASVDLSGEAKEYNFVGFPQLVNSTYHHSIIEKTQKRIAKLFPILCNDIYTAALFLNIAEKYCYVDEPLYLHRIWEGSETTGYQTMFEKYPEEKKLDYTPLKKLLTSTNYVANVILRAKSDWGADYTEIPENWDAYFETCIRQIMYLKMQGNDVSEELQELESVSLSQFKSISDKNSLSNNSVSATDSWKAKLKKTFLGKKMLEIKYRHVKFINSSTKGFEGIEKSAESINENFLSKYSSAENGYKTSNKWGDIKFKRNLKK